MLGPVLCLPEEEHKQPQLDTTVGRAWFHLDAGVPRTALAFTIGAAAQSGDLAGHTDKCRVSSKTARDASKARVSPLPNLRSHRTQPTAGQWIHSDSMVLHPASKDCLTKESHSQRLLCFGPNNEVLITFQVGLGGRTRHQSSLAPQGECRRLPTPSPRPRLLSSTAGKGSRHQSKAPPPTFSVVTPLSFLGFI